MSQLHKRLEHLVNYSSQLIFVSSDSIADQQRTLTEFLSRQHDTTEVSFFSAQSDQTSSDYRRTICRHLANHTVGSYVRPLKELLSDLDANKGHYLVCITHAHLLDEDFLSELWDWVTSCREQQQDLHINIILFGEQEWTEQAQTTLPSHNINKPVLLSSQSVDAVGFDVNALENLMAQKRAFFASEDRHSILKKKWFIASVLSLFLLIFVTLIAFQYPDQFKYVIENRELPLASETAAPLALAKQNDTEANTGIESGKTDAEPSQSEATYIAPLEIVEDNSLTDSILVSNWPKEDSSDISPQKQAENTEQAEQGQMRSEKQDFKVADIVSVEQLDEQQVLPNTLETSEASLNDPSSQQEYPFDEEQLLKLGQNQIVLQLSGMQNLNVLNEFLSNNSLGDITWVYQTQRYGGDWFVVLLKETYDNIAQASAAISELPLDVQQSRPFAKRVVQVQQEILQP